MTDGLAVTSDGLALTDLALASDGRAGRDLDVSEDDDVQAAAGLSATERLKCSEIEDAQTADDLAHRKGVQICIVYA